MFQPLSPSQNQPKSGTQDLISHTNSRDEGSRRPSSLSSSSSILHDYPTADEGRLREPQPERVSNPLLSPPQTRPKSDTQYLTSQNLKSHNAATAKHPDAGASEVVIQSVSRSPNYKDLDQLGSTGQRSMSDSAYSQDTHTSGRKAQSGLRRLDHKDLDRLSQSSQQSKGDSALSPFESSARQ